MALTILFGAILLIALGAIDGVIEKLLFALGERLQLAHPLLPLFGIGSRHASIFQLIEQMLQGLQALLRRVARADMGQIIHFAEHAAQLLAGDRLSAGLVARLAIADLAREAVKQILHRPVQILGQAGYLGVARSSGQSVRQCLTGLIDRLTGIRDVTILDAERGRPQHIEHARNGAAAAIQKQPAACGH